MHKRLKISLFTLGGLLVIYYLLPFAIPLTIPPTPTSLLVYDTHNQLIGEIVNQGTYRHQFLSLHETPPFIINTIVALEDQSFRTNDGISRRGLFRAVKENLKSGTLTQGGSTISSQLIRNTFRLNHPRTLRRKLCEFYGARILNTHYTKEEILERYLNKLSFGGLTYGFQSAAYYYFGRPVQQLTKAEQLALITIAKNATVYNPLSHPEAFKNRFLALLDTLYQRHLLTAVEHLHIKEEPLTFGAQTNTQFNYVIDFLKKYYLNADLTLKTTSLLPTPNNALDNALNNALNNSLIFSGQFSDILSTTIDQALTEKIEKLTAYTISDLHIKNVSDYAVLLLERETNALKVMIGGDKTGKGGQVNATTAVNQVGSTLKPFLYLLAFQNLGRTPETTVLDLPIQYETEQGYAYNPKNFSMDYQGEVRIAEALAGSLNVPAVRTLDTLGTQPFLDFLHRLGIESLKQPATYYGLSLALGAGEISLYELTRAYSVLAHSGQLCDIQLIKHLEALDKEVAEGGGFCEQIVAPHLVQFIIDILSNRYYKLGSFPLNSNADFPRRFVVLKTGTSRNFSDTRAMGFTRHYIIGVRVGNKDGSDMESVSGVDGAGAIFKQIVELLEPTEPQPTTLPQSPDNPLQSYLQITSPLNGSTFTYDPSIPSTAQKIGLSFSSNLAYDTVERTVNGQPFSGQFLDVIPGTYQVEIRLIKNGSVIASDKSQFHITD